MNSLMRFASLISKLKETESVAVSDGVKTSAKKPSAKKIVRRRTRKKEDAQPISVQDPISEKQVGSERFTFN